MTTRGALPGQGCGLQQLHPPRACNASAVAARYAAPAFPEAAHLVRERCRTPSRPRKMLYTAGVSMPGFASHNQTHVSLRDVAMGGCSPLASIAVISEDCLFMCFFPCPRCTAHQHRCTGSGSPASCNSSQCTHTHHPFLQQSSARIVYLAIRSF